MSVGTSADAARKSARATSCLIGALLCAGVCASAQQVNLSHDLVTLGIAAKNLTPDNPNLDARPLFQAALNYAKKHGTRLMTCDTGTYYFLTPLAADRYMSIDSIADLTIDLQGSDLYVKNSYLIWLAVIDSQRVTLTNFTLDSQQLPFTQVRVASVASNQRTLNYATLPGWPSPASFNAVTNPDGSSQDLWALVFRDGALVPGTNRLPIARPLQEGILRVQSGDSPWTQPAVLATYQPGDIVVLTARGGEAPIMIAGGDGNVLRNVDVYASGAIGVHLDTTSNSQVDHVHVMPRPGTDRLISTNADGIHLSFAQANNSVRECTVIRTVDDAIAINSPSLAFVDRQTGTRQIRMLRNFDAIFPNGLPVLFVNTLTAETMPAGRILAQTPPYTDPVLNQGPVSVTFDRDLPAVQNGFGMIYADPASRGAGSVIEHNLIEDVFSARGIYLGGVSGVTVQHNTIRRTNCGAIVAHEDVASYSVGPSQDIQIINNTVEGAIGPAAVGTGVVAAIASIFVVSTDLNFNFVPGAPNTNITVANNYIADSGRGGIWISNVNGGSVENNTIVRYSEHPELAAWGLPSSSLVQLLQDFTQPVVVRSSTGVTVGNNGTQRRPRPLHWYNNGLDAVRKLDIDSRFAGHN